MMTMSELMQAWNGRCAYCNRPVLLTAEVGHPLKAVVDNFIPHRCGGEDVNENQVLVCSRCQTVKGGIDPRAFLLVWLRLDRVGFLQTVTTIVRYLRTNSLTEPTSRRLH